MKKSEMRSSRLLEMLQLNKRLGVKAVAESLDISEATVRRLLSQLETEGKVIRTHGGVRLAPHLGTDYSYYLSSAHRSREKTLIGRAAAEIVSTGDRLFLDSGTTVLKFAEALALRVQSGSLKNLVVLTNSIALVEALSRWCRVILLGGEVRVERRDVCGSITEETLRQFRVNRAFLGADAVHIRSGLMTADEHTAKMDEIVLGNANHSYALVDSEKFNRDSFIRYAALSEVEKLITDPGISEETFRDFTAAGAMIEVASFPAKRPGRFGD